MDFDLPSDDDPRRLEVRKFLAVNPNPSFGDLGKRGYVTPHWPEPWGLDANPEHQLIIDDELKRVGIEVGGTNFGVGWAGPTIIAGGTKEQQERFIPAILDNSQLWCQLFSEPDAGSDLASLRTKAVRDGDVYIVNGQKIWSTWANHADWGILLVRTSDEGKKQNGITYLLVDMTTPGIDVRPIFEMSGGNHFNETFLTDVAVPIENRIGEEGDGWRFAKVTLGNERVSLSEGGVCWGMGPSSDEFFDDILPTYDVTDPLMRQQVARVYTEYKVLGLLGKKIMTIMMGGNDPGPYASIRKTLADVHGQNITALRKALDGSGGLLGEQLEHTKEADPWHWAYLFSRALTVGGGTSEVQRDIIGERLLGLPREPPPKS